MLMNSLSASSITSFIFSSSGKFVICDILIFLSSILIFDDIKRFTNKLSLSLKYIFLIYLAGFSIPVPVQHQNELSGVQYTLKCPGLVETK